MRLPSGWELFAVDFPRLPRSHFIRFLFTPMEDTEVSEEKVEGKKPIEVFRSGPVSASVFAFDNKEGASKSYSTLFSRSYTKPDGKTGYSKGLQRDDMPHVILVALNVSSYLHECHWALEKGPPMGASGAVREWDA
jgi:hypothetical protein